MGFLALGNPSFPGLPSLLRVPALGLDKLHSAPHAVAAITTPCEALISLALLFKDLRCWLDHFALIASATRKLPSAEKASGPEAACTSGIHPKETQFRCVGARVELNPPPGIKPSEAGEPPIGQSVEGALQFSLVLTQQNLHRSGR